MSGRYLVNQGDKYMLTTCIKHLIENTQRYIKVSSFLMQDATISEMLKELALSGKAAVFLISNKKDQETEEYRESTILPKSDKEKHVGFDNHARFLKDLFYSGIHVRLLDNLHAKFIISDGTKGLIMSANLAPNSLMRNIETGIEIDGTDVKELEYVFDTMYKHADIVKYQGANQKDITVKVDNKINPRYVEKIGGNIRLTIASCEETNLTLCKVYSIYNTIIDIIRKAQKYVYIATYHFKFKENVLAEFMEAVRDARSRGVEVILYSNTMSDVPSLKSSKSAIRELKRLGCHSFGDDLNHSKCVLSESKGILFTANIDGVNGMKNGFEVGCVMNQEQRKEAEQHINNIINKNRNGK